MKFTLCIVSIILLIIKYYLVEFDDYRTLVDNEHYFSLFENYQESDLELILFDQFAFIGAVEPLSAFVFYLCANSINVTKIPLFLTCLIYIFFIINTRRITFVFMLYLLFSFIGFYEFILFEVTHRLKVAYLVLLMCITFTKSITALILPVVLSHTSTILIFAPIFYKVKKSFIILFTFILIAIPFYFDNQFLNQFVENKSSYFVLDYKIIFIFFMLFIFYYLLRLLGYRSKYFYASITFICIITILYMIGRSRYFMLLYFMFITSYFIYDINWPKIKHLNISISDLTFFLLFSISLIKSYDVIIFYLNGTFSI